MDKHITQFHVSLLRINRVRECFNVQLLQPDPTFSLSDPFRIQKHRMGNLPYLLIYVGFLLIKFESKS